ncbi:phosphohydrolase, partial [Chloroflexota bacterium]
RPDKKLAGLEVESIVKKFKQKGFAAGVDRQQVSQCSELGLELNDFIKLGLEAMKAISAELGL